MSAGIRSIADHYYRPPKGGRLGDVIPFGHGDEFHIFFLDYHPGRFDFVPPSARKTSWGHLVSRDLLSWDRLPDAISPSEDGVDAASCATGSVIERDGVFHLYYTGRSFTPAGDRREVVCEATSTDLVTWRKREESPVLSPDPLTDELDAFRDPHVYRDPTTGEYAMLVTATDAAGLPRRSGALALAYSSDLVTWRRDGYFWNPHASVNLECADIFAIGDWWYLVFSTAEHTYYRRSRSPRGPWAMPPDDRFDGRWFYAGKSAQIGTERVLFGWLADRTPGRDDGLRSWGGTLISRPLRQRADGSLAVGPLPRAVVAENCGAEGAPVVQPLSANDGFKAVHAVSCHDLVLEVQLAVPSAGRFGVIARSNERLTTGYRLSFDVARKTMSWSNITHVGETQVVSRPCRLEPGQPIAVQLTLVGSVVDVVAAGSALCARAFDSSAEMGYVWAEACDLQFIQTHHCEDRR